MQPQSTGSGLRNSMGKILLILFVLIFAGAILGRCVRSNPGEISFQVQDLPTEGELVFPQPEQGGDITPFLDFPEAGTQYDLSRDWQIIGLAIGACADGTNEGAFLHLPSDTRVVACCIDPEPNIPNPIPNQMYELRSCLNKNSLVNCVLGPIEGTAQRFRIDRYSQP